MLYCCIHVVPLHHSFVIGIDTIYTFTIYRFWRNCSPTPIRYNSENGPALPMGKLHVKMQQRSKRRNGANEGTASRNGGGAVEEECARNMRRRGIEEHATGKRRSNKEGGEQGMEEAILGKINIKYGDSKNKVIIVPEQAQNEKIDSEAGRIVRKHKTKNEKECLLKSEKNSNYKTGAGNTGRRNDEQTDKTLEQGANMGLKHGEDVKLVVKDVDVKKKTIKQIEKENNGLEKGKLRNIVHTANVNNASFDIDGKEGVATDLMDKIRKRTAERVSLRPIAKLKIGIDGSSVDEKILTDAELVALEEKVQAYYEQLDEVDMSKYQRLCDHFIGRLERRELLKNSSIVLKTGPFSTEEQRILKHKVNEYLRGRNLTIAYLQERILKGGDIGFMNDISKYVCSFLPYREYHVVHIAILYYYHPNACAEFTEEDDFELMQLHKLIGPRWEAISKEMLSTRFRVNRRYVAFQNLKKQKSCEGDLYREYLNTRNIEKVAEKYNVRRFFVRKRINEEIARVYMNKWDDYHDFAMAVFVAKYNYYCGINDIGKIFDMLEKWVAEYSTDEVEGAVEAKTLASCERVINTEGIVGRNEDEACKEAAGKESISDESNSTDGVKQCYERILQRNEAIKTEISHFLTRDMDFNVEIQEDDVFWVSVRNEFRNKFQGDVVNVEPSIIRSKFCILCKKSSIVCYTDLIEYIKIKAVHLLFERMKNNF